MLSSLAKYIFGGMLNNASDETPQYETREVNDWLLVNMPNQSADNFEDLGMEDDEDEILTCLPRLLTQDNSYDKSFIEEEPSQSPLPCALYKPPRDTSLAIQSSLLNECLEDFQILPESLYLNHSLYYPSDFSLVVSRCFTASDCDALLKYSDQSVLIIEDKEVHSGKCSSKTVVVQAVHAKIPHKNTPDKRVSHPAALSRNYVNHQSPVLPPKTERLEQIKTLKPVQRAIEYELKKHITRSQLNRRNKNYIYETSTKTNRRKNLLQNHSGANNNRKC